MFTSFVISYNSVFEVAANGVDSKLLGADGQCTKVGIAIRAGGFVAKEFWLKTTDGYVLNVVSGTNPLLAGKRLTCIQFSPSVESTLRAHFGSSIRLE